MLTWPRQGSGTTTTEALEPLYGGSGIGCCVTVRDIAAAKARGEKRPMLTAYDALTAAIFDQAAIPVLLVGDSAAMVVDGHDSTISVTVDELIPPTAAVVRGTDPALVVALLVADELAWRWPRRRGSSRRPGPTRSSSRAACVSRIRWRSWSRPASGDGALLALPRSR